MASSMGTVLGALSGTRVLTAFNFSALFATGFSAMVVEADLRRRLTASVDVEQAADG